MPDPLLIEPDAKCRGAELFGAWSIEPEAFGKYVDAVNGLSITAVLESSQSAEAARAMHSGNDAGDSRLFRQSGDVAIIDVVGPVTKFESSFQSMFGGTSTLRARRAIRDAVADDSVASIMLRIDSPGGTVAGTADLVDDVRAATKSKRVVAFIEDLGASAAYWIATAADSIVVNRTGKVGSIGVLMTIADTSKQADEIGVKVHTIATGFFKGAGTPGTEITDEQLAELHRLVESTFAAFRDDVQTARGLTDDQMTAISTGQVWVGAEAVMLGLADEVGTLDTAIETARNSPALPRGSRASLPPEKESDAMSDTKETATGATITELKAAFPDESDFVLGCAEKNMTLLEAKGAFADVQTERLAASKAEATAANERAEKAEADAAKTVAVTKTVGTAAVAETGTATVTATEGAAAFNAKRDELIAAGMPRHEAHSRVCRQFPELRAALVEEHNEKHAGRARREAG